MAREAMNQQIERLQRLLANADSERAVLKMENAHLRGKLESVIAIATFTKENDNARRDRIDPPNSGQ